MVDSHPRKPTLQLSFAPMQRNESSFTTRRAPQLPLPTPANTFSSVDALWRVEFMYLFMVVCMSFTGPARKDQTLLVIPYLGLLCMEEFCKGPIRAPPGCQRIPQLTPAASRAEVLQPDVVCSDLEERFAPYHVRSPGSKAGARKAHLQG